MKLELYCGVPENIEGRSEVEVNTYKLLDSLGIKYERADHEPADNMEACKAIDEVLAPAVICKNLFLCNRQKTKFYLLMIKEDKKFRTAEISKQINSARLSFAGDEFMEEFLKIKPGAVSVMGLMNDTENNVQLLVDEDVLNAEYVGCHPCVNTSSLRIKTDDVFGTFLNAVHHDYIKVHLTGEVAE